MQKTVVPNRAFVAAVPLIRRFIIAIGIGLTLASLNPLTVSFHPFSVDFASPFDILKVSPGLTYSSNSSSTYFLLALVIASAVLLITNVMLEGDRLLACVSGIGALLLGYFLLVPVAIGSSHLGDLSLAPKLGLAGSALIALGAAPLRALGSFKRSRERRSLLAHAPWLLAAVGLGVVVVSLWQNVAFAKVTSTGFGGEAPRYWSSAGFTGGHTLGIFMLALAIVGIAMALADAVFKIPALGRWALAVALLLLGLALFYPAEFAFHNLTLLSTGGGLALEGGLLASAAALIAVGIERGAIDLRALSLQKLVAIVGIGLALSGTWSNIFGVQGSFWIDGTLGGLPALLLAVGALLVAASFAYRSRWFLFSVSVIGWILVGYFGYYIAQTASDLKALGPAMWLGVGGGALMGLSTVSMRSLTGWKRRSPSMTLKRLAPWLATAIGTGLVLVALPLDTESAATDTHGNVTHISYWNFVGHHALGIVMLVICVLVFVTLIGAAITRLRILSVWTLAVSLALFGLAFLLPTFEAFNHLGALRSGGWLAFIGSLIGAVGAVAMAELETLPEEAQVEDTGVRPPVSTPARSRKAAKGKVPGMHAGR